MVFGLLRRSFNFEDALARRLADFLICFGILEDLLEDTKDNEMALFVSEAARSSR